MPFFKTNSFTFVIIWLLVITSLSAFSGNKIPEIPVWNVDKLAHIIMYGVLSFLLLLSCNPDYLKQKNSSSHTFFIVLFCIFYGGFMEILQHYVFVNRSGNLYDFIANIIGSISGVLIYPYVMKLLP